jgi:inner membrane protein YhjD
MKRLIDLVYRKYEAISETVKSRLREWRSRSQWFDHQARAYERYQDRPGDRLAAALTYYAFLAFFPLTALAFALVGYVVAWYPQASQDVTKAIDGILPGLSNQIPVHEIANAKLGAGLVGLVLLSWGGLGFIGALRESLRAIWAVGLDEGNFFVKKLWDAVVMVSLGVTLLVSVALSGSATSATHLILTKLHLVNITGADLVVRLLSLAVALATDMIIFFVMFSRLSGTNATWRELLRGTLLGAIGLEALKLVGTYLVGHTTRNPIYASFAVTIGLLVWINLSSRFILYAAAWTATRRLVLAADAPTEPIAPIGAAPAAEAPRSPADTPRSPADAPLPGSRRPTGAAKPARTSNTTTGRP